MIIFVCFGVFFFKQKTAYEMRISDWSSDVCSSDLATKTMRAIEAAAREVLYADNERVHAFTHLSHVYRQGCSIYSTFVFRSAGDPDEDMARWRRLKSCVSMAIIEHGGTISHQHGVGVDHRSEEHTSELQSLMRISYAVFCLKKKKPTRRTNTDKHRTRHTYTE